MRMARIVDIKMIMMHTQTSNEYLGLFATGLVYDGCSSDIYYRTHYIPRQKSMVCLSV